MNVVSHLAFFSSAPGPGELLLVFVAVLLLFGPRRLPEVARTLGRILNDLRRAGEDFHDQVMRIDDETLEADIVEDPDTAYEDELHASLDDAVIDPSDGTDESATEPTGDESDDERSERAG